MRSVLFDYELSQSGAYCPFGTVAVFSVLPFHELMGRCHIYIYIVCICVIFLCSCDLQSGKKSRSGSTAVRNKGPMSSIFIQNSHDSLKRGVGGLFEGGIPHRNLIWP